MLARVDRWREQLTRRNGSSVCASASEKARERERKQVTDARICRRASPPCVFLCLLRVVRSVHQFVCVKGRECASESLFPISFLSGSERKSEDRRCSSIWERSGEKRDTHTTQTHLTQTRNTRSRTNKHTWRNVRSSLQCSRF